MVVVAEGHEAIPFMFKEEMKEHRVVEVTDSSFCLLHVTLYEGGKVIRKAKA